MKLSWRPLLLCLLLNLPATGAGQGMTQNTAEDEELLRQRKLFLAAEEALREEHPEKFQRLKSQLTNYPLHPYLTYQETHRDLRDRTPAEIRRTLAELQGTPLQNQLLENWLALLAEERLWLSYLSFHRPGGGITRQCHYLQARIKSGNKQLAFKEVESIWLSGRSRPKVCDPVLEAWIAAGHLTESLVWQRFDLAMQQGQTGLARYLKRYLDKDQDLWADRWLALYRDPAKVRRLPSENHPMLDEMAVQAIQRLARQDIDAAYAAWLALRERLEFNDRQHLQVARSLMGQLSRQETSLKSRQITELLPKQYLHLDSTLTDKELQLALRNGEWESVLVILEGLPKQERESERWRYWQARALISLGRREEGEPILANLSTDRSYYGFLSAQRLGQNPSLSHQKLQTDPSQVERLAKLPGLLRARELYRLDRPLKARREWNLALQEAGEEELKAASRLAERWSWPSQGIITLARLRQWDDLELRFPLAHRETITGQAQGHGIDSAWIYAILRQESAFMTDAKSSVGARGLMQLMPKTAEAMASELRQPMSDANELYRPEFNIRLGASYLNKIFRRLQENPLLATAAYNAGPVRVESWLPEKPQAADIWIETVPFKETREYLKRVFAYTVIYNYRLGQDPARLPTPWLRPIEDNRSAERDIAKATTSSGA